ncbi:MAG: class I SAM-dependent methyltransferase [Nitrososphaera sp.]|nr:class I SAM-dependent methyltransferase [Nitrososphaera sp.]
MQKRIWRVISRLDCESNKQRSGKVKPPASREMLAITADTGMFYSILLKAIKATSVLEIGTSAGFSTLWFADALESVAKKTGSRPSIITIESDHEKVEWAGRNFKQAGVGGMIRIMEGGALDLLRHLGSSGIQFDFVFIDADKENMIRYFELALPYLKRGGIIAADNMLYPEHFRPLAARYARHVRNKRGVQSVTLPIGMGEEITLKL